MQNISHIAVLVLLLAALPAPCFALREIAPVTKSDAKELGIEMEVKPAGPDALRVQLEFSPHGRLADFTHVELKMTEGNKSLLFSSALRETRTESGTVMVTFTSSRAYVDKITLLIVMQSPGEAGDHVYELQLKELVDVEER